MLICLKYRGTRDCDYTIERTLNGFTNHDSVGVHGIACEVCMLIMVVEKSLGNVIALERFAC